MRDRKPVQLPNIYFFKICKQKRRNNKWKNMLSNWPLNNSYNFHDIRLHIKKRNLKRHMKAKFE